MKFKLQLAVWLFFSLLLLAGCTSRTIDAQPSSGKLKVIATTTILGDVARQIGGDMIDLQVLLPIGVDVHSFQYTPQDVTKVANAGMILLNGAGLESFIEGMLESAGNKAIQVSASDGIALLEPHQSEEHEAHDSGEGDPHVWTDPNNVIIWTNNIARALGEADPANAGQYQVNAEKYQQQLSDLDQWIKEQVAQLPPDQRQIVSDHQVFTYFAERYDFQLVGAIIPSYSTVAEPNAQELAALEDAIRQLKVKAIFVGSSMNPALARRVVADTGTQLITIYTGSLTSPDGPAGTYLDYMHYNVQAIINALK